MKRLMKRWLLVAPLPGTFCLAMVLLATASPLGAQTPRPMTVEDQFAIKRVSDAQVSPAGEWIAYEVSTTNLEKDETKSQIWMVSTQGGEPIPLTLSLIHI